MIIYSDLETWSAVPISVGTWAYAEQAKVLLWAYAIDDGPVKVWDLTESSTMPGDLAEALSAEDALLVGHNWLGFDSVVLRVKHPEIQLPPVHDTMLQALAHGLPGGLDKLCAILGVDQNEAKLSGKRLIRLFCTPESKGTRETHPSEWAEFKRYAAHDIKAVRSIYGKLPKYNYPNNKRELALVELDSEINARGIAFDRDFVIKAIECVERVKDTLADAVERTTVGVVKSASQVQALLQYLKDYHGLDINDLKANTVEAVLENEDLPDEVRLLLTARQEISKSSTAKLDRMLKVASSDNRLRGLLQIYGAPRTGRWSGRLVQPQNFPRPDSAYKDRLDEIVADTKAGILDLVEPAPIAAISSALRSAFVLGDTGVSADLSNIEGRVLAWLAGEAWKIKAFEEADAGRGADIYCATYSRTFGVPIASVTSEQRQLGKVLELALGYGGGVGAFATFASAYGLDLEEIGNLAYSSVQQDALEEAATHVEYRLGMEGESALLGLSKHAYIGLEGTKRAWRKAHPATVAFWTALESAWIAAVRKPDRRVDINDKLAVVKKGRMLFIKLPSGRLLCYLDPVANDVLSYHGVNSVTKRWCRINTYGGKLAENVTQAVARDVLAEGMLRAEAAGCEILLTVHDEILATAPGGDVDILVHAMKAPIDWAPGLPLSAKGQRTGRYAK